MYLNKDLQILAEPRIRQDGRLPEAFCIFYKPENEQEKQELLIVQKLIKNSILYKVRDGIVFKEGEKRPKGHNYFRYSLYRVNKHKLNELRPQPPRETKSMFRKME
jgi:hypothetical protein